MQDKIKFKEILAGIVESAQTQENKISTEKIRNAFAENALTEEQYEFVYSYLESEHITVEGRQKKERPEETKKKSGKKEKSCLTFYLQELEGIREYDKEEEAQLLRAVLEGDAEAKNRIIEGNLKKIVNIAEEFIEQGMPAGDLIQEGNMGFLIALEQLQEEHIINFDGYWEEMVRERIRFAINEQISSDRTQQRMLEKLNALDKATKELTEELERTVTVSEISKYMEISEEEAEELIRLSKQISDVEKHRPKL